MKWCPHCGSNDIRTHLSSTTVYVYHPVTGKKQEENVRVPVHTCRECAHSWSNLDVQELEKRLQAQLCARFKPKLKE